MPRDEHEPALVVAIRPGRKLYRRMGEVLHDLHQNRSSGLRLLASDARSASYRAGYLSAS